MIRHIRWLGPAACAALVSIACDESRHDAQPDPAEAPASGASERAAAPGEGTIYDASIRSTGAYQVGEPAEVEAVLEALGGYKCNAEYPYKFRLDDPPEGVKLEREVVKEIDREDDRAVMTIPFQPTSAGKKEIAGTFYFSVCNDETCKIAKKKLSVTVDVAGETDGSADSKSS